MFERFNKKLDEYRDKIDKFKEKGLDKVDDARVEFNMKKDDAKYFKEEAKSFPWKRFFIGLLILPFALWAFIAWFLATDEMVKVTTKETRTIDTVIVERKAPDGSTLNVSENIDVNFVYTDKGAFVYKPSWLYLQEETSDQYAEINEQTYYVLTHYGIRFSFFKFIRIYENIIDYRKPTREEMREYLKDDPEALIDYEDKIKRYEMLSKEKEAETVVSQ